MKLILNTNTFSTFIFQQSLVTFFLGYLFLFILMDTSVGTEVLCKRLRNIPNLSCFCDKY